MGCLKINHNYDADLKISWERKVLTLNKTKNKVRSNYWYGFGGKESDNEVKGDGNQQDYGFRIYDTRLGKYGDHTNFEITDKRYNESKTSLMSANSILFHRESDQAFIDNLNFGNGIGLSEYKSDTRNPDIGLSYSNMLN